MIDYKRTDWYGWGYLCQHLAPGAGSVFPKCLPPMIIAAILGGWSASPSGAAALPQYDTARALFGETYGMQVFGIVFGFLCVARLNICYSRYWEGVTSVKMMHSKFSDAAAQACAFDRVKSHDTNISSEPFCRHLVHLFSQLSAMATMSLHVNKAGLEATSSINLDWLRAPAGSAAESDMLASGGHSDRAEAPGAQSITKSIRTSSIRHATSTKPMRKKRAQALNDTFTKEELDFYEKNRGCAVHTTVNRIIRTLTTRMNAGGLPFAPPIISRIYQELSNGLLAYNQAIKLKEVAVPFVYVQYQALLLLFFTVSMPFAVGAFTSSQSCHHGDNPTCDVEWGSIILSSFLSAIIVGSFNAMWLVANEMEDPFGMEPNDIPMMAFHYEFCGLLKGLLDAPWMHKDDWTVASGPWVHPTNPKPEPAAAPAAAGSPGASKWGVVREAVLTAPATSVDATQIALHAFSSSAKQSRLKRFFGLSSRKLLEEAEDAEYVSRMKQQMFVIPA